MKKRTPKDVPGLSDNVPLPYLQQNLPDSLISLLMQFACIHGGGGTTSYGGYQRKVPMYAIFLAYARVIHTLLILGNVFVTCVTYHWNQRILLNKVDYLLVDE
ncbi:hypothetical protein PROFUN_16014 [Planoprotostelium fungivorum]|uniref:Uncharacterized protein n=1 Tax=Planoprotostelium fungivorum TaxID=1890364 RepID=A0A2P6MT89_9EUKA|nr:hypothetical protein PROFUN_16014 [Planoprotostelium fungivorum]